jgi:hypothetical protein
MTHNRVHIVQFIDALPGLDVTEIHHLTDEHIMSYDSTPKIEARRRWKRLFGLFIVAILVALLTTITEVHATEKKPHEPTPANITNTQKAHSQSDSSADASSTSGSVSGANSGSTSNAAGGQGGNSAAAGGTSIASTGPSVSGASSTVGVYGAPVSAGSTSSSGPITVAPSTEMNSSTTSRALALAFPAPVAPAIAASSCLVAGNRGFGVGFNFFSHTAPESIEAPVCSLRAMAAEADMACQYRTAAEMRAEAVAIVLKRDPRPVPDTVQDLSPEQCMLLKQPRIVMPQANTTYVDASQWQTQDLQPPTAVQSTTPAPRPRPRVTPTPVAPDATPTCGAGETNQCVPAKPAPGSFNDIIRR